MMNMKRLLSLILAFVLVLGMIPVPAFANEGEEVPSVDVVLSLSADDCFMVGPGSGAIMAMKEISVPYFDLALYGLEEYYFVSESYGDDGDGLPGSDLQPGTPEYANGKVTLLHLYIYALEVFYCGVDPEAAGKGYLYDEGLIGTEVFSISGSVGSSFLNQFWGGDCNLNYYVNYEYPLASEGWGATSDQILLREGDIITLGHFTGWSFYADPYSIFNYITADKVNPVKGEEVMLTLYYAGANLGTTSGTAQNLNTHCLDVYCAPVDDIPSEYVTDWQFVGTADENGELVVNTAALEAGEYIFAVAGQPGDYTEEICSTPGGVRITVEEPEKAEIPEGAAIIDLTKLEGNKDFFATSYYATIEGLSDIAVIYGDNLPITGTDNYETWSPFAYTAIDNSTFVVEAGELQKYFVSDDNRALITEGYGIIWQSEDSEVVGLCFATDKGWTNLYLEILPENEEPTDPVEPVDPVTATVYFSVTKHWNIVEAEGVPMVLVEMTVPYFDIGLYGLENIYYNPDCYGSQAGASSQVGGTPETAKDVVTILHAMIWATEVYYNGLDEADAGKGWLAKEGGWNGFSVLDSTPGSAFINFWGFGSNTNYYLNYEYPLAYPGWGATCDQLPITDGDVISVRYNAYTGNDGLYYHFGKPYIVTKDVLQGNQVNLTLFACTEDYTGYTTGHEPVGEGEYVYVVSEIDGDVLVEGTTNAYGDVRLDTSKLSVGTYYVLSDTFDPAMAILNIVPNVHTHKYNEVVTEPTCTEGGYTTYTCSCGDSYVGAYTSALGHDVVDGTCTRCGLSQTVIPEGAPFLSMVTDKGETVTITDMGMDPMYDMGTMYKVEVPLGTERVDVTYNEADVLVDQFGYAVAMMMGFSHVSQEGYPQSTADGKTTVGLSMVKAASNGAPMPVELLNVPYPEDPYELRYMGLMNDDQSQFHFFVFTYKLEEGQYFVDLPAGVGYTVTGEPIASNGYTFNVSIAEGYEATADFAVLVNGEVVATEPGDITIESVTADLHIEVDGVVKIVNPETDISVTIDLSGYDGVIEGSISYMNMSYESVDMELKAGKKNSLAMTATDNAGFYAQIYTISPLVLGYDVNGTVYPIPSDYTGYDLGNGFRLNLNYDGYMNLQTNSTNPGVFVVKPIVATPTSTGAAPAFAEDCIRVNDIAVLGADVESYAWEGDTLNVVLAADTAPDASIKTMWNIFVHNTNEGAGNAMFNINGRLQTPSPKATFDWANGIVLADGAATMTVAFEVADTPWDPNSALQFTNKTFTVNFTIAAPHEHSYEAVVTAPTCTEGGYTTYTCACGDSYIADETAALGHDYVDGSCTRCGEVDPDYVAPALTDVKIIVPDSLTPADDGVTYYGLKTFQNYTFTYETEPAGLEVDAQWKFVDGGNNTTNRSGDSIRVMAYMSGTCTLTLTVTCGDMTIEKTITITDEMPHEHSYEAVVTAPTCTEGGFTTYTCSICGESYVGDETAALGHTEEIIPAVAPTCTETGLTEGKKCTVCGEITVAQEVVDALGHTEEIIPAVAATCYGEGLTEGKKCSDCGEILIAQEIVPATGHDMVSTVITPEHEKMGYTLHECANCDYSFVSDWTEALGHEYEQRVIKEATCTEDGEWSFTCSCGKSYTQVIPKNGHSCDAVVTDPTCTEIGYTTHTCANCDFSYITDIVAALGHNGSEAVIENEIAATCTKDGSYDSVVYCSVCNEELTRETVTVPSVGHTEEILPAVAATCTEDGLTEGKKCSICNEILIEQEVIPATGHTWKGTGCENCDAKRENPFTDFPEDSWFIDSVLWAAEEGITEGAAETTFNPTGDLLRAQVVTMLWRHAGSPVVDIVNPFTDVKEGEWYYDAVLWAYSEGITAGTSAATFDPAGKTNRAQAITFLWRYLDEPEVDTENPFTDVDTNEWYGKAVAWAVANGVTEGMSENQFGVSINCNRAHMVTFMYRALA